MDIVFDLVTECNKKLLIGYDILKSISSVDTGEIAGVSKLKNKVKQEISFLSKTQESGLLKKEHVLCTNLHHYEALASYMLNANKCTSVLKSFIFYSTGPSPVKKRLCVDVVSEGKRKWTKVIARNPRALSLISKGEGEYGQRSVIDQALEYTDCAGQNLNLYKIPVIEFHFACGIESDLANTLLEMGIFVSGEILENAESDSSVIGHIPSKACLSSPLLEKEEDVKLNLDVTTMIAYISALTNGHAHRKVRGWVLSQQAEWERERPIKPVLDEIFAGRKLYACETAVSSFKSIVSVIAGKEERVRAEELLEKLVVVPDAKPVPGLQRVGSVKERPIAVFSTGRAIQAVTVSANAAFVRSAARQGVTFEVIIHETRALTEMKEIDDDSTLTSNTS